MRDDAPNTDKDVATGHSVTLLIQDLRDKDPEAAARLWDRYAQRLLELAKQRLRAMPRRAIDEEDVVASVFESLCFGAGEGRFPDLNNRDELWRLLATITHEKAVDQIRHNRAQKRGGGTVRGESVFSTGTGAGQSSPPEAGLAQAIAEELTPDLIVAMQDQLQYLLSLLRDETLRQVAVWRLEGFTNEEIAEKLGVTGRTVERKLNLIREEWRQVTGAESQNVDESLRDSNVPVTE